MTKFIMNFFNGLAIGITETIPGVSGGTIAIILGFYNELIYTVNHFTRDLRKHLIFITPILLGVVAGLIVFSSVINYLLTKFSFPTMAFFIGLIVGIIPLIFIKVKTPGRWFTLKESALILLPLLALLILGSLRPVEIIDVSERISSIDVPFMLFILVAGIIAAAALVVPGISGSFMLLLMGIYPLATHSVSSLGVLLTDISNTSLMLDIAKVLAPLAIGIIIGGLSTARLIGKLLKKHYKTMYSIILGLLVGSIYVLFRDPIMFQSGSPALHITIGIVTLISGSIISFSLGKKHL